MCPGGERQAALLSQTARSRVARSDTNPQVWKGVWDIFEVPANRGICHQRESLGGGVECRTWRCYARPSFRVEQGVSRQGGEANRADCGRGLERDFGSAPGGAQREHLLNLV